MAEHHPLQYWLESINLPQYYIQFINNGLIHREQCVSLNEQILAEIGVTLPGHQKRILSHLPNNDNWIEDNTSLPNLPPKKKSVRDSYLYQNIKPPDSLNVQTDYTSSEAGAAALRDSPRPVPRPRTRNSAIKSPATTPSEEQPKPLKRPTPAPRNLTSPKSGSKLSTSSLSNIEEHANTSSESDKVEKRTPEENSMVFTNSAVGSGSKLETNDKGDIPGTARTVQNLQKSVKLDGVCMFESSTDEPKVSDTYSFPVKRDEKTENVSDMYSFPVKKKAAEEIQNIEFDKSQPKKQNVNQRTKHSVNTNIPTKDNVSEEIYVNLEDQEDHGAKNIPNIPERCASKEIAGASYIEQGGTAETYENAEFDSMLGMYQLKLEEPTHRSESPIGGSAVHTMSEPLSRTEVDDQSEDVESSNDAIYEPIWEDKRQVHVTKPAQSNRASSLMQFPSLDKDSDTVIVRPKDRSSVAQTRMSTFKNRDSASFNMPPPLFAPPPLPASVGSMKDVIADFDPLKDSTKPNIPPVPPRPTNYTPPKLLYRPYENVQFPMGAESSTLPGHRSDIEPEMPINSPTSVRYQDAITSGTEDPFKYEDPFGQFEPDCEDFNSESFPPPCNTRKQDNKTVNSDTKSDAIYEVAEGDAIYEAAEDPDDFDPFGLNRKPSHTSLPRSISSGSSGSQYKLNEVPPAPKWFQATPETGRMYSVAGNLNDGDSSSDASLDDLIDDSHSLDDSTGNMTQVDILPTKALSPRKKERSGYLYKQGGVKQNRGWRKRWVIFDGKTLRYYSNSRDQVSKRIVPVSCMTKVEIDVKPSNSRQFKFKLHCTNRVFLFATDNLDDCQMWSNTLMEAIINYAKPEGGEVPGGDMANPDIDAWIKVNRNRYKFYLVLKNQKLCYYQNADDYTMASPLHEIDMKLSSVKEVDRTKLQLNTHYSTFLMHFESSSDASNWKMAIEEAITNALGDNSILDQVKENPDNRICADCGSPDAHWASMNLGIVLCLRCAGIHRGFDHRLSKIRSLRMDTKVWNSSLIEMFKEIGNDNSNNFWLRNMPPGASINVDTPSETRKQHIYSKYKDKIYCDKHPESGNKQQLNEALLKAAQTDNVLLTYQILMSGADILYSPSWQPNCTAFEMAKEAHQRIQMEFLLQNGGDRTKNFMPGSEEASLVAKLRSEVQWQGYLYKTGSNMKALLHVDDFLKRWCVLEHGHMSYYVSEESKVEKDRIDNESMLCVQAVHNEKHAASFEISSKKNNRVYLFAASNDNERLHWIQCIAQVFCPVDFMDHIKQTCFSIAGYVHLRTGFNRDWQRSWFMLENRKFIFIDKEETERDQDSIDLRKVSSITRIANSDTSCEACLESHGPMFMLKAFGDRVLYMQADLVKDTERIFSALEAAIKKGGDLLEDQALTNTNIPVIISSCIDFIELNGLTMDGLYRKAEQESKIKGLLQNFRDDARSIVLGKDGESVHLVCNVLKRFLRNLKDPLLTQQLYGRWLQTAGESDHNVKLQWYKYLLQQLPRINYNTLKYLATHLSKLSEHADQNLMSLSNISIAFGPTLMKSDKVETTTVNASAVGSSMNLEMKVISDIVTYHSWLFDIKDEERKMSSVEENIRIAQEKMAQFNKNRMTAAPSNMIISVYYLDPKGNAESITINKESTAADIVHTMTTKLKLTSGSWTLHEVITADIERPLHPDTMIWPLLNEWQYWAKDYSTSVALCLKSSSELKDRLEQAHDQSKPLFAEMKYSSKKKGFRKMAFEFTQARLSCYRDTKSLSNPAGSWNIEDLSIYKGCDSKRSPPTKFGFTFLARGEQAGEKEMPCFGHAVCCTSEQDLLSWISGLLAAQHPNGFS